MSNQSHRMLGDLSKDRDNNLNLIRMIAASAVLFGHAWPISLGQEAETSVAGIFSSTAVLVFFGISGFLVTQSMDRTSFAENWLAARALRLFPGLLVVLLLTVLVLGPVVTDLPLPVYFASPEIVSYVIRNFTLAFMQYDLPGVFKDNPYPAAINGSLWTLFYEVVCYGVVFLFGFIALKRTTVAKLLFFTALLATYVAVQVLSVRGLAPYKAEALMKLGFPFFVGMAFYVWRDKLPLSWLLGAVLAGAALLGKDTLLNREIYLIALTYWVFLIAYLPAGVIRKYNRFGDYSYGTYIYAFPVQQSCVYIFDTANPLQNIALALPVTLVLAWLSWHIIEKPSLRKKASVAAILTPLLLPFRSASQSR